MLRRRWCSKHYNRWLRYGSVDLPEKPPCLVEGCAGRGYKRGWCSKHYQRWSKYGSPTAIEGRDVTPEQRFWSRVDKTETCWLWTGARAEGYAVMRLNGKQIKAHRFAYMLLVGPIPDGMVLDHVVARGCRWRHCVNPAHLEPVTERVNILRGSSPPARAYQTGKCMRGHEFTPDNTYLDARGSRVCRRCGRERRQAASSRGDS